MRMALTILVVLSAPFAYGALLASGLWLQTDPAPRDSALLIYPAYLLVWTLSALWVARSWLSKPHQTPPNGQPVSGVVSLVLFLLLGSAFLAACLFASVVLNWGEA